MSAERKQSALVAEVNNGRLAMLGIMGFLSEAKVPGAVPLLKGVIPAYSGEVMAPFTTCRRAPPAPPPPPAPPTAPAPPADAPHPRRRSEVTWDNWAFTGF